ncbi:MAG: glycosyltransferase [Alphaproteobacteria bacterium]|nr:glycosyltransferase [Alphaproteobacteria bacterium]
MIDAEQSPSVSIVTAFYNRAQSVAESLGSLVAQTYPNLEIIAIDDGSNDGTFAEMEKVADARCRLIRQENTGYTVALSTAVRQSKGELIAVHDAGDVSFPERIARQAGFLARNPTIGLLACAVENEETFNRGIAIDRPPSPAAVTAKLWQGNPIHHGAVMYRRSLYDRVGGYRPLFRFAQDHDLWLRMIAHAEVGVIDEVLYRRKKFEGGVSTTAAKIVLQKYLSDFAIQCARSRDAHGRDLIDRHGALAPFLRERSPRLGRTLAWYAMRWLAHGQAAEAEEFLKAAMRESRHPKVFAAAVILRLSRSPWAWENVLKPAMLRRYSRQG